MSAPVVRVLMPCYNEHPSHIREAVDSLRQQTLQQWELVITDDGSTDASTLAELKQYAADSRIKVVYQANAGPAAARNRAAQGSTCPYLLPLDADDTIDSTFLDTAVRTLEADPALSVVYGQTEMFGAVNTTLRNDEFSWPTFLRRNVIPNTAMFRRADFEKIGGYDVQMRWGLEDYEFYLRLLDRCNGSAEKLMSIRYSYRIKESSRNNSILQDRDRYYAALGRIWAQNGNAFLRDPSAFFDRERDLVNRLTRWQRRYGKLERLWRVFGVSKLISPL